MFLVVHRYQPQWIARAVGNSACDVEREVGGLGRRVSQDPFDAEGEGSEKGRKLRFLL